MLTSKVNPPHRYVFLLAVVSAVFFLAASAKSAYGYDNDTHFWLTYYLARQAGYTHVQSTQIASADVSVDLDADTRPVTPKPPYTSDYFSFLHYMQTVHARLHALAWQDAVQYDVRGAEIWSPYALSDEILEARCTSFVDSRKKEFWQYVWKQGKNPGVFLHYLQDSYAHEYFMGRIGHAGFDGVDFISTDVAKAKSMARMTLRYLIAFKGRNISSIDQITAPAPENLDLDTLLGPQVMALVDATVEAFAACNNMTNKEKNGITRRWDRLPKLSRGYDTFTLTLFIDTIIRQRNLTFVPNSFFARREIIKALNLPAMEIPEIWEFNLNSDGDPVKADSAIFLKYKEPQPPLPTGVIRVGYEASNKIRTSMPGKCLMFALVPDAQGEFTCQ